LEDLVEIPCSKNTTLHGCEYLNVTYGVKAEFLWDKADYQFPNHSLGIFGFIGLRKVEVAHNPLLFRKDGHLTAVHPM
jgi:hypothetical protein